MKKRIFIWSIVILCGVISHIWFFHSRNWVDPNQVERVELYTSDHSTAANITLTEDEAETLLKLYNRSRHAGEVTAEPGCDGYRFTVYLKDGSSFAVSQGLWIKMIVRQKSAGEYEEYYVASQSLVNYIHALAEKHDMPIN
ncbi:MAG: hypothetical protein IJ448_05425 [Oscillospiraceae bacterium]|nr:hypothetical protein [Oscillospiraceae bacterium]